jgi:hypothetical protein
MDTMTRSLRAATALPLAACTALAIGCGSQTKTESVAGAPTVPPSTATAPTSATGATGATRTPTSTTAKQTTTDGGTPATSTRTAPEPAFTQQEGHAEGPSGAAAVLHANGYAPKDSSQYHSNQTLRVLIGTRIGSAPGTDERAFFFIDGRYIGTDAKLASATVSVVAQSDTEVTLAYPLYRPSDPVCCPGGGQAHVRFQLNNGKLVPLDPIPPASSTTAMSRN